MTGFQSMMTLKQFFLLESIRQGLSHIHTMTHEQFGNLIADKKIHIHHVTEKTDGATHKFGYDEHGFYSQSSGSGAEKMRSKQDYETRAKRRAAETGKPLDFTASTAFGHVHEILQKNSHLQSYLKRKAIKSGGETSVKGELFHKGLSRPSEDKRGEIKFVGTSYDPSHMGHTGKIVIHSKLPENQGHDTEHFKRELSNEHINFDDDIVKHKPSHVDVGDEHKEFHHLNHELLNSRTTPKNKADKEAETKKFEAIKKKVSEKVDHHISKMGLKPKWGSGTEGVVVHPRAGSRAPRFKVTSASFREYKSDPSNSEKFKSRGI
jgi:hypothetical protein